MGALGAVIETTTIKNFIHLFCYEVSENCLVGTGCCDLFVCN